jgi:hypothetical protein
MNKKITSRFDRARFYLERVRADIRERNPAQGMADSAELGFQAQALWNQFEAVLRQKKINGKTLPD